MPSSQVSQGVYTATPGSWAEPALCSFILSLFRIRSTFEHKTWSWREPKKGTKAESGQGQEEGFFGGDRDISPAQAMTKTPVKGLGDLVRVEEDTEVKKGERDMLVHKEYQAELTLRALSQGLIHYPQEKKKAGSFMSEKEMTHFEPKDKIIILWNSTSPQGEPPSRLLEDQRIWGWQEKPKSLGQVAGVNQLNGQSSRVARRVRSLLRKRFPRSGSIRKWLLREWVLKPLSPIFPPHSVD